MLSSKAFGGVRAAAPPRRPRREGWFSRNPECGMQGQRCWVVQAGLGAGWDSEGPFARVLEPRGFCTLLREWAWGAREAEDGR